MRRRRATALAAAIGLFSFVGEAFSEETAGPSWTVLQPDTNVSFEAICALYWLMAYQETQKFCKLPAAPIDDALSREVKTLQDFLIANSSYHPTPSTFIEMRRSFAEEISKADTKYFCGKDGYARIFKAWKTLKPNRFEDGFKKLLAKPSKPDEPKLCFP